MAAKTKSATERLASLELLKQELIKKRYKELLNIMTNYNALTLDDKLFTGFLIFATNPDNKAHPTLQQFIDLAKSRRLPSNSKSSNQKSTKTDH